MQMRVTLEKRGIIEFRLRLGMSKQAIACVLKRDHIVVAREIVRNGLVLRRNSAFAARNKKTHPSPNREVSAIKG